MKYNSMQSNASNPMSLLININSREDEFSPLKNADTAAKDTPTTSRLALYNQHRRFLHSAGATIEGSDDEGVEISPLVTFAGEGLEEYSGKHMKTPICIDHRETQNGC